MRGPSAKIALFQQQKLETTCFIHQIKDIIVLYLMMYFILRKNIKVENDVQKILIMTFIFDLPHLHQFCTWWSKTFYACI